MGEGSGGTEARGGVLRVGNDGRVKWATKGAQTLLGLGADELVGLLWKDTFSSPNGTRDSPSDLISLCKDSGKATYAGKRVPSGRHLRSFLEEEDDGGVIEQLSAQSTDAFDEALMVLDYAERLQQLSAALSEAFTLSDAVDAFVEHALPALGGHSGAVLQPTRDHTHLTFIEGRLSTIRVPERFRQVPLDRPGALVQAWNGKGAQWISGAKMYEALLGESPASEFQEFGVSTLALIPMRIGTKPVGLLVFNFTADAVLDDTRRHFAEVVAHVCAHAFERARLAEEERIALKAIADKEKRLRLALQTGRMLTWEYDVETGLLSTNDNAAEVGVESTAPRTLDAFAHNVHPDDRAEVKRKFNLALETTSEFETTFRRRFADGSWRWLKTRAVCVYGKDGKLQGFLGVSRDVDEEKKLEIALRTSEEMLRTVGDTQPVMVWTSTASGKPDFLNAQFMKYTGFEPPPGEELNFDELWDYIHPEDEERLLKNWTEGLESGTGWEVEYRIRRHDGVWRWFLGRTVPVRDEIGDIRLWVGSATDIDDQKQALAEREALLKETQEAVQGREVFLAVAAHELRTPLTPLRLHVDTLLKSARAGHELKPDRIQRGLEVASRQIHRLQLLVEALLDVSRIASGQIEIREDHVDLEHIAREVVERHHPESNGAEIRVVCETPVHAWMDRLRVEQVLTNLVTNAIKYGNGSPVRITLSATNERVHIRVSDQGLGISESDQARIFGRFERARADLPHGGLGLGLWIVQQIVQSMGGAIEVKSELGEGSTFTVNLPRGAAPAN